MKLTEIGGVREVKGRREKLPGPIVEWALPPREKHISDDPHAPHVGAGAGLLAVHHLGRHELYGALEFPDVHLAGLAELLSQSEVNDLQSVVRALERYRSVNTGLDSGRR